MNDENTLEIIEQARRKMHETVDRRFDDLIALVQGGEIETESDFELSLCDRPTYFKGKKPVSVIYPDNTEFETSTWKKVAKQLLNECAGDAVMYDRLHRHCNKVSGRDRVLLSESPDGMNSPICFADGMYFESKFDTETLLHVITKRILDPIGYDYSGIRLKVYDPALRMAAEEQAQEPECDEQGFGMQML